MLKIIERLHADQGGSAFVETALLIIGVALAVAPFMFGLGQALGDKINDIKDQVEQVGV